MRYCVIIPTYNNDKTLEGVITEVGRITKKIIVVNDGSTDKTSQILDQLDFLKIISYSGNKGKGYAIRKALIWQFLKDSIMQLQSIRMASTIRRILRFLSTGLKRNLAG